MAGPNVYEVRVSFFHILVIKRRARTRQPKVQMEAGCFFLPQDRPPWPQRERRDLLASLVLCMTRAISVLAGQSRWCDGDSVLSHRPQLVYGLIDNNRAWFLQGLCMESWMCDRVDHWSVGPPCGIFRAATPQVILQDKRIVPTSDLRVSGFQISPLV